MNAAEARADALIIRALINRLSENAPQDTDADLFALGRLEDARHNLEDAESAWYWSALDQEGDE